MDYIENYQSHLQFERWRGRVDERLNHIDDSLKRLENTIADGIAHMTETIEKIAYENSQRITALDSRIHDLENHSFYEKGKYVVIAFIAGMVGSSAFTAFWKIVLEKIMQ